MRHWKFYVAIFLSIFGGFAFTTYSLPILSTTSDSQSVLFLPFVCWAFTITCWLDYRNLAKENKN